MHDRFAINDIESLNLKSRVRERGIERERLLIYWAFFRMQRLMRAYFLQRFSNGQLSNRSGKERKNLY